MLETSFYFLLLTFKIKFSHLSVNFFTHKIKSCNYAKNHNIPNYDHIGVICLKKSLITPKLYMLAGIYIYIYIKQ